jgi:pimeloyl-ACP methyl ester carboxylesterase
MTRDRRAARIVLAVSFGFAAAACGGGAQRAPEGEPSPTASASTAPVAEPVDIGGRSLFLECQGAGGPTVVLEAGLTGDQRTWDLVIEDLPPDVRACSYDRANIGESDPAPTPRSAQDVVDDLSTLLEAAGEEPPYVLVGFSFGGIFVQLYAADHPEEVTGIVLVESNHPDEARQFERHLTDEQIAEDRAIAQDNPEGIDIYASYDELREAGPLPDVPLIVITASEADAEWPPGWDPELFDRLRAQQQADLASLVPGGRQIIAEDSAHEVPAHRPEVVVDAILEVLG